MKKTRLNFYRYSEKEEESNITLFSHYLDKLGFKSKDSYLNWCQENGLSTNISRKTVNTYEKEISLLREQRLDNCFFKNNFNIILRNP